MRWRMKALESCRNEGKVSKSKTSVMLFCNFLLYNFPGSSSGAGSSTSTAKPIATISFKRKKEEEITSGTKKVKNSENGEPSTS